MPRLTRKNLGKKVAFKKYVLLFIYLISFTGYVHGNSCNTVEVIKNVNVRVAPDKTTEKVGRIHVGERYSVIAQSGNWVNYWFDEKARWSYKKGYLKDITENCAKVVNTKSGKVNVRSRASNKGTKVDKAPDDSLWVTGGKYGNWYQVWYKSKKAYIHKNYIEEITISPELVDIDIDENLLNCLKSQGYNNALEVFELHCVKQNISSIKGLEYLTFLQVLNLSDNLLKSATFRNNEQLKELNLSSNQLTDIDLSQNLQLETLLLNDNALTKLDVSQHSHLRRLAIEGNKLVELNTGSNNDLYATVYKQHSLDANLFDTNILWPLCGRIDYLDSDIADTCTNRQGAEFNDWPLAYGFGPRLLRTEQDRYDFHRGLDIATEYGTPIYAVTDGIVRVAGAHSSYMDNLIILRHYRPGSTSCIPDGCYHSLYMHLSDWRVQVGDSVKKGQLIGFTGSSIGMWPHLHFEIRNASKDDPYSYWQRDSINPLHVLPHPEFAKIESKINVIDGKLTLKYETQRWDVGRVEVRAYDNNNALLIDRRGTANEKGYYINPPFFDLNVHNHNFTHKNSSSVPWSSFAKGGDQECP